MLLILLESMHGHAASTGCPQMPATILRQGHAQTCGLANLQEHELETHLPMPAVLQAR